MKKIFFTILIAFIVLVTFSANVYSATTNNPAEKQYTLLEPIQNIVKECTAAGKCTTDLGTYISGAFAFAIGIAAILAVLVIVWAGIEYMMSDAWTNKADAKSRIWKALGGLGLALFAYLLLSTINPDLIPSTSDPLQTKNIQNVDKNIKTLKPKSVDLKTGNASSTPPNGNNVIQSSWANEPKTVNPTGVPKNTTLYCYDQIINDTSSFRLGCYQTRAECAEARNTTGISKTKACYEIET